MINELIIPSEIPWQKIKGKELEELLYWLFDSMGAKNLEWRIGGTGGGAADQGRDLECFFYMSSPEGDLTSQTWWIEAKGRKSTVEPADVKESVLNAAGIKNIDILVIATNSNFSNPTRDWVKQWQDNNKRPIVKLWEKTDLEKYCSKHPVAVMRLFSKALSHQGKLEVTTSKYWNYAKFTDEQYLKELWENKNKIELSGESLIALVASEFANGNISKRPWAVFADEDMFLYCFSSLIVNALPIILRAHESGSKQLPVFQTCAYFIMLGEFKLQVHHEPSSRIFLGVSGS